jgi:transcriptional regulator with XRE-family HTH domain
MAKLFALRAGADREPKRPNALDMHVGNRLRARRLERKMSQEELARRLGVTHRQLQKYEAGLNRISASRLYQVALERESAVGWFFEEFEKDTRG